MRFPRLRSQVEHNWHYSRPHSVQLTARSLLAHRGRRSRPEVFSSATSFLSRLNWKSRERAPGGEIRDSLAEAPEPDTVALIAGALAAPSVYHWRKKPA